jgi:myosin heavy subunit
VFQELIHKFVSSGGDDLGPHIYGVADTAYRNMIRTGKNQAVCIAGESGAGKTETMKVVLQYLAEVSAGAGGGAAKPARKGTHSKGSIEDQILQTNPITEGFGNAKTVRNNNSSRFGKWTALSFEQSGKIRGAYITDYLLEKSRVAFQVGHVIV